MLDFSQTILVRSQRTNDKRKHARRNSMACGHLTVMDGTGMEIMTQNLSLSGIRLLAKQEIGVGQICQVELEGRGPRTCKVVRSRVRSSGYWDISVMCLDI